ncbi:PEP-CTERM sorting domain-containing protein [Anabaena sp. UHCC 0187]|uniref:PEP-CTERM sorting domain-containing protein n=1 Tax=Anabaena sp. UHCC 0187 TaxID=2590018 RepID=UPI001446024D|nr:PEP-CTERM sorting domain-containing protein [Anabaena sp. UHCC 0187]MTJ13479.1 PEP-CTERM sorting domain-containing protein [Anabaena sp. UHCC 0187]
MKVCNLQIAKNVLLTSALGAISLISLIDVKPSFAGSSYYQSSLRCSKSVPEPSTFIGVLALGIFGGGYLLKQQMKKKGDFSTSINQEFHSGEENYHDISPSFELQLIDPTTTKGI